MSILAILSLEPDLQVLAPLGAYLTDRFGITTTVGLLSSALGAWIAAPLAAALYIFRHQEP